MLSFRELLPLDEARRARVLDWLTHRCPDFRCLGYGGKEWSVCGLIEPGGLPLVCLGCPHCGHVAHFCAVTLGVDRTPMEGVRSPVLGPASAWDGTGVTSP